MPQCIPDMPCVAGHGLAAGRLGPADVGCVIGGGHRPQGALQCHGPGIRQQRKGLAIKGKHHFLPGRDLGPFLGRLGPQFPYRNKAHGALLSTIV